MGLIKTGIQVGAALGAIKMVTNHLDKKNGSGQVSPFNNQGQNQGYPNQNQGPYPSQNYNNGYQNYPQQQQQQYGQQQYPQQQQHYQQLPPPSYAPKSNGQYRFDSQQDSYNHKY